MTHYVALVRAVDGKPAKMAVISAANGLVYVARVEALERVRTGVSWPVGFPEEDVFEFEPSAFDTLMERWRKTGSVPRDVWRSFNLRRFQKN